MLAQMKPHFPIALGVIRSADYDTYDAPSEEQIVTAQKQAKSAPLTISRTVATLGKYKQ